MIAVVNFFIVAHILVAIAALVASVIRILAQNNKLPISGSAELKLNYFLILLCALLPFVTRLPSSEFQFEPVAKVMAAKTYQEYDSRSNVSSRPILSVSKYLPTPSADFVFDALALFVGLSLLIGAFKFLNDIRKLHRIIRGSFAVRNYGKVTIAVTDKIQVPFSVRLNKAWVIVPMDFLSDPLKLKISVLHELQHHRQNDTIWIYILFVIKSVMLLNPLMWMWSRVISETQEIACDENLVDQDKVKLREYAHSLITIAETAIKRKEHLACAAGLAFLNDRHSLTRRIQSMLQKKNTRLTKRMSWAVGLTAILTLASAAFAARNLVVDRRISMGEAQSMARLAKLSTDFPITLNDAVLKQLNRFIGTEQGRNFIRLSLQRMETYRPVLEAKFNQYQMPNEIMAIGVVESGYQNLPQSQNQAWGAGVWMFIESTARNFGMRVDDKLDERLNFEIETDAAMRYLSANNLRFKDWQLAIMAYNIGEKNLQKDIEKVGSRNAWDLIRAGAENDKDYLAKVMAVILIMKNPSYLN